LIALSVIFGRPYTPGLGGIGAVVSSGWPSSTHRGSPPSMILEFSWPKLLNMNNARGDEKTPWESYLQDLGNEPEQHGIMTERPHIITCVDGDIPSFSKGMRARGKCKWSKAARTTRCGKGLTIWHHMLQTKFMRAGYLVEIEELRARDSFGAELVFGISWRVWHEPC